METQLKKVALASACTLTGPTGFDTPDRGEGSDVILTFIVPQLIKDINCHCSGIMRIYVSNDNSFV